MRIQRSFDLLAAMGMVLANRALLRAGLRPHIDGWRRATGLVLRDEASTFVLSAFGLDVWSDVQDRSPRSLAESHTHVADRLSKFLMAEPACHVAIQHGELEDRAVPSDGPSFTLAFQPSVDGPARFIPPDDWNGEQRTRHASASDSAVLLNIVCRVGLDGQVDLWMRVNHAGADGVPMQEMLSRLEASWGAWQGSPVLYPSPQAFSTIPSPRPLPGRPDLCEVQGFVDFAPLLAWRKHANASLSEPMTLSAALLWCLARHASFADLFCGTTVEVAASNRLPRGVGVVVVRPTDYLNRPGGLARYVTDFNRAMELTRRRVSSACKTLDAAALLPARFVKTLLLHALEHSPGAFGTLGLTMLKDARVFGAPLAQAGHTRGFIAVGSVSLASDGDAKVGCVTVKGPCAVVREYPILIQQAVAASDDQR